MLGEEIEIQKLVPEDARLQKYSSKSFGMAGRWLCLGLNWKQWKRWTKKRRMSWGTGRIGLSVGIILTFEPQFYYFCVSSLFKFRIQISLCL